MNEIKLACCWVLGVGLSLVLVFGMLGVMMVSLTLVERGCR